MKGSKILAMVATPHVGSTETRPRNLQSRARLTMTARRLASVNSSSSARVMTKVTPCSDNKVLRHAAGQLTLSARQVSTLADHSETLSTT